MSDLTKTEIGKHLAVLAEIWGKKLSEALVEVYHQALSPHMDLEEFQQTCQHILETAEFWPSPAAFLKQKRAEAKNDLAREAEDTWMDLTDSPSRYTTYINAHVGSKWDETKIGRLGDRAVLAFRAVGGGAAMELALTPMSRSLDFTRKAFVDAYSRASTEEMDRMISAPEARKLLADVEQRTEARSLPVPVDHDAIKRNLAATERKLPKPRPRSLSEIKAELTRLDGADRRDA